MYFYSIVLIRTNYFWPMYILEMPEVSDMYFVFLKPTLSIIVVNSSKAGNLFTDSGKYVYALGSLEMILPNAGRIFFE